MKRIARWALAMAMGGLVCPLPAIARPEIDVRRVAVARFGNDAPWYVDRIPFFESSDPQIDAVYYYRWGLFRAHQRDLGAEGYISTEFLDDVSWQRNPYASLNDATGFHIGEGRWLRDPRFTDDYIDFMYTGGNDRHFTDYMADSVWGRYLVDGDAARATRHLGAMRHIYRLWDDRFDFTKGLYWIEPLADATEYTISSIDASGGKDGFTGGEAFRPSINAYMAANARAIARLSRLAGQPEAVAHDHDARADAIVARMHADLWSPALGHFIDRYKVDNAYVKYWSPIRGRELVGYLPWTFDLADDTPVRAAAWAHLLDPARLGGKAGMRTVEPNYEYYMRQFRYEGGTFDGSRPPECQWNGPIWPFQTTQVLLGLANLLDHYDQSVATRGDYWRLLRQYTRLHYQGARLDLEEDYHPDTGKPIVGLARSHHYFHSGYVDLILGGLVGIRPRADDRIEVNPLLPADDATAPRWFRVQDVPYHGRRIAITWDDDGSHYGRKGLTIEVDGQQVASRPTPGRLIAPVERRATAPAPRPITRSVQLVRGGYPMGSASSATDAENVHDAIDGRIWFYPELPNGWSSDAASRDQWYAIDFGRPVRLDRAEIAFFANGKGFAAPSGYRIEAWTDGAWRPVGGTAAAPVDNGITDARWPAVETSKVRLAMRLPAGKAVRLAEWKLF